MCVQLNIEYCRYFTVETDEKTKKYTLARLDSFRFLYSLFLARGDENATEETFFEYIENFLEKTATLDSSQIGLYSSLVLDLVSADRLVETLKFFLQTLEDTPIKSGDALYKENTAEMFIADANLN